MYIQGVPKKQGFVFKAKIGGKMASNQKAEENRLHLEFIFTYLGVFLASAAVL